MSPESAAEKGPLVVARCVIQRRDGKILILRRSEGYTYPGFWEIPGGKFIEGTDLKRTLLKEVFEECGLNVRISHDVGHVASWPVGADFPRYAGRSYLGITYVGEYVGGTVRLSEEHQDFHWANLVRIDHFSLTQESQLAIQELAAQHLLNSISAR